MSLRERIEDAFAGVAGRAATLTGSFWAFAAALLTIVVWALLGPIFHFSDTWQLVIDTSTTIVTFLMVFIIQHAQNKEMRVVQMKLNELIAAVEGASNRLIDVESLTDQEVARLYERYQHLARTAERLAPGTKMTVDNER